MRTTTDAAQSLFCQRGVRICSKYQKDEFVFLIFQTCKASALVTSPRHSTVGELLKCIIDSAMSRCPRPWCSRRHRGLFLLRYDNPVNRTLNAYSCTCTTNDAAQRLLCRTGVRMCSKYQNVEFLYFKPTNLQHSTWYW